MGGRLVDRMLAVAVALLVSAAAVEALRPDHAGRRTSPRPAAARPAPAALAGCRRVDRWLLRHGRRTSEYLKLPCGR